MPARIKTIICKNFKFEVRSIKKTIAEIAFVIISLLCAALFPSNPTIIQYLTDDDLSKLVVKDQGSLNDIGFLKSSLAASGKSVPSSILYTPEETSSTEIMSDVVKGLTLMEAKAFSTANAMMNRFDSKKTFAAVELISTTKECLNIAIHPPSEFRTLESDHEGENLWVTRCSGMLRKNENTAKIGAEDDLYVREGFLQLQHQIFLKWLEKVHVKDISALNVSVKAFSQHTKAKLCSTKNESNFVMLFYSFTFFLPFLNLLWRYGREREENILVHHWRYGFDYAIYWMCHGIVSFIHLLLLDVFIVILALLPLEGRYAGSPLLLMLYLITYNIALLISVVFLVSVSNKARHAVLLGATIWLIMFSLFSILVEHYRHITTTLSICFIAFFNNGFAYGMRELQGGDNNFYPILTMVGCCVFYWILISLAEYFNPGPYIKTLPFTLCCSGRCLSTMNKPPKKLKDKEQNTIQKLDKAIIWKNFEFGTISSVEVIRLKNVSTLYSSSRVQLKNITMRIYANEITVILGPHCSGKTTIIQILAGWKRPIVGKIQIDNEDLYENWNKHRHKIDVCMPNNALFDLLTVEETLIYYMRLKHSEVDMQKINMELDNFFESVRTARIKRNVLVKKLTFSEKRLLSLGCVLAGGTKIVLLDEPTLHMKGKEQRLFWQILHKEKTGRAIVMTTFDVTEADAVADRIAMLGEGALHSYGTPFFLKSKLAIGCDLIIVKSPTASTAVITELIGRFIPGIIPENEIGELLYYKLPNNMRPKFQNMLIHLEKEQSNLGIVDLRLLGSELTEVYMAMGARKPKQVIINDKKLTHEFVSSKQLGRQQIYALLNKKLTHQAPNIIPLITIGVSFLFILLVSIMAKHSLHVPPTRYHPIKFGVTKELNLDNIKNCKSILIANVIKSKGFGERSMNFGEKSLYCMDSNYEKYLKESKSVSNKFGAIEIDGDTYTCWFNRRIFHSAPVVLNLMHNIYLAKTITDDTKSITTIENHPEHIPLRAKIHLLDQEKAHLVLPMVLGIALPISIACFIVPLVQERKYHLLTLQKIAGVSMARYWSVNLLWDYLTFFSYSIIYTIILALAPIEGYNIADKLYAMLLLNIYGIAGLGLMYVLSLYFYWTMWSAFLIAVIIQVITGIFSYIIYWDVMLTNEIFFYIWSIFPTFSLMEGISNLYTQTKEQLYCDKRCKEDDDCDKNDQCASLPQCCFTTIFTFEYPGILVAICYMLTSAIFLFIALCIIESRRAHKRFKSEKNVKMLHSATHPYDDRDVMELRQFVAHQDLQSSLKKRLMVDQLEYKIPKKSNALSTISFLAEEGQCLAIYGTRHSGKSHVAEQLIGQRKFAFGDIFVDGIELKYEYKKALTKLSYVPQDYGMWESFTPREILRLFCMLRGIQQKDIRRVLRELSSIFIMSSYMDEKIRLLSVDRRRKVSIALALIAQPTVIVLDEPTRGLNPRTCREIWNVLRYKRFLGKTLVFTTSNGVELEALSDRALIYNEGEMLAIGNAQYLRSRYTKGFYLCVKLKIDGATNEEATENLTWWRRYSELYKHVFAIAAIKFNFIVYSLYKDSENLVRFVTFLHEDSELQVRIDNCFKFYLPVPIVSYSFLYGSMEKNKRRLNIADYSVSQGTLQDVFNAIEANRNVQHDSS